MAIGIDDMICDSTISILFFKETEDGSLNAFLSYLEAMSHIRLSETQRLPHDLSSYDIVITQGTRYPDAAIDRLSQFVHAGGGWQMFVDLSDHPLPEIFGVQQEPAGPAAELRVLFENAEHPLAARLPDAVYLKGRYHALRKAAADTVRGRFRSRVWVAAARPPRC